MVSGSIATVYCKNPGVVSITTVIPPDADRALLAATCEREALELKRFLETHLPDGTRNILIQLWTENPPR